MHRRLAGDEFAGPIEFVRLGLNVSTTSVVCSMFVMLPLNVRLIRTVCCSGLALLRYVISRLIGVDRLFPNMVRVRWLVLLVLMLMVDVIMWCASLLLNRVSVLCVRCI